MLMDIWYSMLNMLMYSIRGALFASVALLITFIIALNIPTSFNMNGMNLEIPYLRFGLMGYGLLQALGLWLTLWIKDYKRDYLPRWIIE